MGKTERLQSIDFAKGICIILVVIGHCCDPALAPHWYSLFKEWVYLFHMPFFMFASGLIYATFQRRESYFEFQKKKILRLMIPYLAASFLIIALKYLTNGLSSGLHESLVKMLYYPEASFALWFIWSLWTIFLIVPIFKTKKAHLILFVIAIALHYLPIHWPMVCSLSKTAEFMMWFMTGVIIADFKDLLLFVKRIPDYAVYSLFMLLSVGNIAITEYVRGGYFIDI